MVVQYVHEAASIHLCVICCHTRELRCFLFGFSCLDSDIVAIWIYGLVNYSVIIFIIRFKLQQHLQAVEEQQTLYLFRDRPQGWGLGIIAHVQSDRTSSLGSSKLPWLRVSWLALLVLGSCRWCVPSAPTYCTVHRRCNLISTTLLQR